MNLGVRIVKRQEPLSLAGSCLVMTSAILVSLFISGILLFFGGTPPAEGIITLFKGAFGTRWALEDSVVKAIPVFLCALGVAIAFRLKIWNIGAEGQFALGAVGATWIVLSFPDWPPYLLLPAMALASLLCGGLWGFIPALLRQKLQANEIIVTLMLNYIAILFLDLLVYGIWKDPSSFGFPMTETFSDNGIIGKIGTSSINWGIVHCIILGLLTWIFLTYTRTGYEIKASGDNVNSAKYAGMPYNYLVYLTMFLSGALAGWAGFIEASATVNRLQPSIMVGYGYTAIVVAWLARLHPVSIGIAAFLLAGLRVGSENLQLEMQVPSAFSNILEGLILLTVLAGGLFTSYRLEKRKKS